MKRYLEFIQQTNEKNNLIIAKSYKKEEDRDSENVLKNGSKWEWLC